MPTVVFLTIVYIVLTNQRVSPSGRMNHGSWIKRQKRKLEPIDSIHIRPNFSKESRVGVSIAPHPPPRAVPAAVFDHRNDPVACASSFSADALTR